MKAILMVWTFFTYPGYGSTVSHTVTPVETIEACTEAKKAAETIEIKKPGDGHMVIRVIAVCTPL